MGVRVDQKLNRMSMGGIADGATARELLRLGRACDLLRVPAGTVLQHEHERSQWCWAIVDGVATMSRDGRAVAVAAPGTWVLDGLSSDRSAVTTMMTASDVELVVFGRREMLCALEEIPALARAVSCGQRV